MLDRPPTGTTRLLLGSKVRLCSLVRRKVGLRACRHLGLCSRISTVPKPCRLWLSVLISVPRCAMGCQALERHEDAVKELEATHTTLSSASGANRVLVLSQG